MAYNIWVCIYWDKCGASIKKTDKYYYILRKKKNNKTRGKFVCMVTKVTLQYEYVHSAQ